MPTSPPRGSTIGGDTAPRHRLRRPLFPYKSPSASRQAALCLPHPWINELPERGKQKAQRKALAFQAHSVVGSLASPQFMGFLLPYPHESPPPISISAPHTRKPRSQ
jgi:hypothetical protein